MLQPANFSSTAPPGRRASLRRPARALRRLALALLALHPGIAGAQVESVAQLEAAARAGDAGAMTKLAARYELGEGVAADFARANRLYCDAAQRGDAEAQVRLGVIYANGRGVPRNEGFAAALFEKAAGQGHDHARRLLEFMLTELQRTPAARLPDCRSVQDELPLRLSRELALPRKTGK